MQASLGISHTLDRFTGSADIVPENIINLVSQIDAETWIIQKRLLTIAIVKSGHKSIKQEKLQPMARINQLNTKLEEFGHHLETHQNGWYNCLQCGQTWQSKHRYSLIANGKCPGPEIWENTTGMYPDIPKRVVQGSEIREARMASL